MSLLASVSRAGWLALWLLLPTWANALPADTAGSAPARYLPLDTTRSVMGFELTTHLGQRLQGRFTHFEGGVQTLEDGRHQVALRMFTDSVEIIGHPRYSQWARGHSFFDSARWPEMRFVSQPYDPATLRGGGQVPGELTIRGITHPRALDMHPAACARPTLDCPVVSIGVIQRSDYGMDSWLLAVDDQVRFVISAWMRQKPMP